MIRPEEDRVECLVRRVEELQNGIATARLVRFTIGILARQVQELRKRVDQLEREARSKQ
jgi:polyhydroxyalkanoate synthesis regulator phasin